MMNCSAPKSRKKCIKTLLLLLHTLATMEQCSALCKQSSRCDEKSSCADGTVEFSPSRNCQCDAQCSKFGDCCRDSEHYQPSPLSDCVEVGNWNIMSEYKDTYYMVRTCPDSWLDQTTQTKCEKYLETIREDPILGHPLTSKATNITYANSHCARCNSDLHRDTMVLWRLVVTCGKNTSLPIPEVDEVLRDSTIDKNQMIIPKFNATYHSCNLYEWRPLNLLRKCHKGMIDECPKSWKNESVRNSCETYSSFVYFLGKTPYRNPHCALCNKRKENFLCCGKEEALPEKVFPILFDFSDDNGIPTGKTRMCKNENEAYDHSAKKCRNIIWAIVDETPESVSCHGNSSCDLYNCSKFVLTPHEYRINGDFTVTDLLTRKKYREGEFRLDGKGNVEICAEYELARKKFGTIIEYVTFLGLTVSMAALTLHLVAFCINPMLRNLSGKNLASLCVALLIAYGSFIIGQLVQIGGAACKVSAVLTYYSFLVSFCWLLMMAFDVWRTLRLSTLHLRVVSRERRWYVFGSYSVISWLIFPGFLLSSALAVNEFTSDLKYRPGFGLHNCWFGNRRALLIFFVVPVGVVMALNFSLYVWSAYMICNTSISPSNKSSAAQRNYKLFARLAILMGLTWITGFVADFMNEDVVWLIFVFLNAFQGLFIFVAFTLTSRVRNGIRSQVSGDSKFTSDEDKISCWSWRNTLPVRTQTTS